MSRKIQFSEIFLFSLIFIFLVHSINFFSFVSIWCGSYLLSVNSSNDQRLTVRFQLFPISMNLAFHMQTEPNVSAQTMMNWCDHDASFQSRRVSSFVSIVGNCRSLLVMYCKEKKNRAKTIRLVWLNNFLSF